MKIVWALLILVFAVSTWSCKKDPPGPPPILDTLGNWKKISTSLGNMQDVWFVTPDKGFLCGDGIYRSEDGGKTSIKSVTEGFINLFFLNPQVGYAQSTEKLAFTINGGDSWQLKGINRSITGRVRDVCFVATSTGYLSTEKGLFKTTDTGSTWKRMYDEDTWGVFFFDSSRGYIYANNKILKTDNAGNTWQSINNLALPGHTSSTWSVLQFIDDKNGMLTTPSAFAYTSDGGLTWTQQKFPNEIWDIHFFTKDVGYLLTTNEIYKTTDGCKNWTRSCKIGSGHLIELYFLNPNTGWAVEIKGSLLQLK